MNTNAAFLNPWSWTERLGEVLAALNDRLHTPTAAAVGDRLTRQHSRDLPATRIGATRTDRQRLRR